jgi:osmotically-inducible protein OsmY
MAEPEATAYVAERIRDDLLHHPDVGELDVHVSVDGTRVVVTGHVSTSGRREAITHVLAELLPDHDVRNETTVASYPEGPEEH